jgi:hypothetical protein
MNDEYEGFFILIAELSVTIIGFGSAIEVLSRLNSVSVDAYRIVISVLMGAFFCLLHSLLYIAAPSGISIELRSVFLSSLSLVLGLTIVFYVSKSTFFQISNIQFPLIFWGGFFIALCSLAIAFVNLVHWRNIEVNICLLCIFFSLTLVRFVMLIVYTKLNR